MEIGSRLLMKLYFNYVYNPVYDFIMAQLTSYNNLQSLCINRFEFNDSDKVLCVGIGTGNEVARILDAGRNIDIVGVDYSVSALKRAQKKALAAGKDIEVLPMDVRSLEFTTGSFDKVLCIHVMDFIIDAGKATSEIVRVLNNGGQFVITYPSDRENMSLGLHVMRDSIRHYVKSRELMRIFWLLLSMLLGSIVYLPLLFRRGSKSYSYDELKAMFSELTGGDVNIEKFLLYNDFIVYGRK